MKSYKIKPPTYLLIAIIVVIALNFLLPIMTLIPLLWTLLGILALAFGMVIDISADQAFHKAGTPVCPFETSSALVRTGVYRMSRNPMYLGFVLVLLGTAILMGSLTPYVIVLAFAFLLDKMFIRMEEQKLAARFGAEWEKYKIRTWRWL